MTNGDRRPDSDTESTSNQEAPGEETHQRQSGDPSGEATTSHVESVDGDSAESVESVSATQSAEPGQSQESTSALKYGSSTDSTGSTGPNEPLWRRFLTASDGPLLLFREVCISFIIVLILGGLLFGISGVWPPMVAVESESMEPNINQYDLVFVTEPGRFSPSEADRLGVVTAETESDTGYTSFNDAGSVIVFDNPEATGPPIIHRAHFFVEEGENWHDRANPNYISASDCEELQYCPAPHDGYITKGDNDASNARYDQANGIAPVVRSEWVTGVAQLRLPYVGYIRLALTGAASSGPLLPVGLGAVGASGAYAIGRRDLLA